MNFIMIQICHITDLNIKLNINICVIYNNIVLRIIDIILYLLQIIMIYMIYYYHVIKTPFFKKYYNIFEQRIP